jgi:hypothetical protein
MTMTRVVINDSFYEVRHDDKMATEIVRVSSTQIAGDDIVYEGRVVWRTGQIPPPPGSPVHDACVQLGIRFPSGANTGVPMTRDVIERVVNALLTHVRVDHQLAWSEIQGQLLEKFPESGSVNQRSVRALRIWAFESLARRNNAHRPSAWALIEFLKAVETAGESVFDSNAPLAILA